MEALQAAAGDDNLTGNAYERWTRQNAGASRATVERHFGSWSTALAHAGIEIAPRRTTATEKEKTLMPFEPNDERTDSIFEYVADYHAERGDSPTLEEISEHEGCSLSTVKQHLDKLAERGLITRTPRVSRSIVIVKRRRSRAPS